MAKNNLTDLSTTNDSNTDIGGANIRRKLQPRRDKQRDPQHGRTAGAVFNEADPTTKITAVKAPITSSPQTPTKLRSEPQTPRDPAQQQHQHHDHHARRVGQFDRSGQRTQRTSGVAQPSLNTTTTWGRQVGETDLAASRRPGPRSPAKPAVQTSSPRFPRR